MCRDEYKKSTINLQQIIDVNKATHDEVRKDNNIEIAELKTRVTKLEGEKAVLVKRSEDCVKELEKELEEEVSVMVRGFLVTVVTHKLGWLTPRLFADT